jgi:hypothetical protein
MIGEQCQTLILITYGNIWCNQMKYKDETWEISLLSMYWCRKEWNLNIKSRKIGQLMKLEKFGISLISSFPTVMSPNPFNFLKFMDSRSPSFSTSVGLPIVELLQGTSLSQLRNLHPFSNFLKLDKSEFIHCPTFSNSSIVQLSQLPWIL